MKKFIVGLLSLFFLFSCAGLCACNFGGTKNKGNSEQGEYVIRYYFEDDEGEFIHDSTKDETGKGAIGKTISVRNPKTFDGYYFDKNNENNRDFDIIRAESVAHLELYYKLIDDSSDTSDTSDTSDSSDTSDTSDTSDSSDSSDTSDWDEPTDENVVLNVLNDHYVQPLNHKITMVLYVSAPEALQGIFTLYNTAETLNTLNAKESYYLFATQGNKAMLMLYNGEDFVEIKSADITAPSVQWHTYSLQIDGNGDIVCALNNQEVLRVAESDFTAKNCEKLTVAGRVGSYNEKAFVNIDRNAISIEGNGCMGVYELKDHFKTVLSKVPANYYVFNATNLIIENKKEEVPFSWIYGFGEQTQALENEIDACTDIAGLVKVASENEERKIQALKQHVKSSLGSFIQLYNDCLLMPMVSASEVEVKDWDTGVSTQIFMSADVYARDTRWWVPNAYMLYSNLQAPNNMGVMDMLESEVNSTNDFDSLYNMSDKYIVDIVRALSYKGLEFYYWYSYNDNPNSVVSQWWFLYTYYGATGANFEYVGNVFTDYEWKHDYRLSGVFFNAKDNAFQTDPQLIMNKYTWMLAHQTLTAVDYTVTLNTNGGTVDSATLTGNSGQVLTLPTPTKSGATFGGWYYNRAYEGVGLTQIDMETNRKDITLYAKWIVGDTEQTLSVDPADVFGSNMVIQQKKPFSVFGTGTDGVVVTVKLDNITKTATIANGKWNVVFEAMEATFTPKTLTISGDGISYSFNGILVGEVWLGAGQSNMQMTLSWMNGTGVNYVGQYGYYDNFNKIRMYRQQIPGTPFGGDENNTNRWVVANCPNQASSQSAYMISFALNLQKKLGVPVGVITSSMGATYIEEWLSNESLASTGSVIKGTAEENEESRYYYGMTELLRGIQISGVIWYQGENNAYAYNYPAQYPNASGVKYDEQLVALHSQYKDIFDNENLPLIVTELAPYAWDDYEDFRITQRKFVSANENTYLLSTVDIGMAYDIHPVFKNELGKRASNIALEFVYKAEDVQYTLSYFPISAKQENGKIVVSFEKAIVAYGSLIGFIKVENEQGVLEIVQATVNNNQIVLSYTGNAVRVYYMYVKDVVGEFNPNLSYYICAPSLYGGNGLPVAPFAIEVARN